MNRLAFYAVLIPVLAIALCAPPRASESAYALSGDEAVSLICRAEYEWGHHAVLARRAGLTDDELRRITRGPEAEGWSAHDSALLRAVDELHDEARIGDATWAALAERYTTQQMMDVVFTVGEYNLVSMALRSFGVEREEGVEGFPAEGSPAR